MKKNLKRFNLFFILTSLCSCQAPSGATLNEYIDDSLTFKENFTICSLNDIHLSFISDLESDFKYVENVIFSRMDTNGLNKEEAKPDLLVLNGDIFMDADKRVVDKFFQFIDSLDIPFAYTYGNHDLQGLYEANYLNNSLSKCKNSLLKNPKDNVYGNSNYVINIKENNNIKWQIYVFDSNTYAPVFNYDVIHDNQIEWYKKQIRLANGSDIEQSNADKNLIPSLAYFHIPFEEFDEAWKENGGTKAGKSENGSIWRMGEDVSCGYKNNTLFETMTDFRSTVGIICAHDHKNCTDFLYSKPGLVPTSLENFPIRLIYGLKSSRNIYHDKLLMGGIFITLSDVDNTFKLQRNHVDYDGVIYEISDELLINGDK